VFNGLLMSSMCPIDYKACPSPKGALTSVPQFQNGESATYYAYAVYLYQGMSQLTAAYSDTCLQFCMTISATPDPTGSFYNLNFTEIMTNYETNQVTPGVSMFIEYVNDPSDLIRANNSMGPDPGNFYRIIGNYTTGSTNYLILYTCLQVNTTTCALSWMVYGSSEVQPTSTPWVQKIQALNLPTDSSNTFTFDASCFSS